ncbi:hypothetical protein KP806_08850 [Paenibacillus sp. N4]|uniref:hypothetical protein n=1 Tax=Paenibacillus vietnamensis TaxID=2590547 RepID=UPI001CD0F344|nr:hypothetical protein [Paenibacillus vietnamensis]MCA0755155.1 hypothetical protein [Paenibacillus vietnamensis]
MKFRKDRVMLAGVYDKVRFQNGKQMFAGIMIKGDTLTYQAFDATGEKLDGFVIMH